MDFYHNHSLITRNILIQFLLLTLQRIKRKRGINYKLNHEFI
jgi:hypothetical protein